MSVFINNNVVSTSSAPNSKADKGLNYTIAYTIPSQPSVNGVWSLNFNTSPLTIAAGTYLIKMAGQISLTVSSGVFWATLYVGGAASTSMNQLGLYNYNAGQSANSKTETAEAAFPISIGTAVNNIAAEFIFTTTGGQLNALFNFGGYAVGTITGFVNYNLYAL